MVTPFLVTPTTYELFEFPKMIFVYLVSTLVVATKLSRIIINWKSDNQDLLSLFSSPFCQLTSISTLLGLFVLSNLISTVFSPFLHTSLWGYYSRFSGGIISIICYFSVFLILQTWDKLKLKTLLKAVIFSSIIVSLYGIAQHFGLEKDRWVQDVQARVFSSFGQPNWLAAYLVLILPLNLSFLVDARKTFDKLIYAIVAVFNFSALWFTFSISGISAFLITIGAMIILMNKALLKQNLRYLVPLVLTMVAIAIWQPGLARGRFEDTVLVIRNRLTYVRPVYAANNQFVVGDTADIRLIVWTGVIKASMSNPKNLLIGTGPETVAYRFWQYRPLNMNQTSEWDFLYNKSHNYFLDILSNLGLLGVFSYLGINSFAIWTAIKNRANTLNLSIGSALIGNTITNFFGWPTVLTNLLFFSLLSILSSYDQK